MPTCTIDGRTVTVDEGTTILRAAESIGIHIPYFCFHPALHAPANCRMCLVEIEKMPKLEPSCRTPVREGLVIHTDNDRVKEARRGVLEFILVNHPVDCPICDQAGECWLQDHYLKHDFKPSRLKTAKVAKVKVHPIGPEVVYDGERCILCTRCVRFCDEVVKTGELTVVERGDVSEIRTFPGRRLDNPYSICTADLCPVGALTARSFRFKRRVWFLKTAGSICVGCARNCAVHLDHFREHAERYLPRFHPQVNRYWMCDAGRYTVREIHADRLLDIRVGDRTYAHWPEAMLAAARILKEIGGAGGKWTEQSAGPISAQGGQPEQAVSGQGLAGKDRTVEEPARLDFPSKGRSWFSEDGETTPSGEPLPVPGQSTRWAMVLSPQSSTESLLAAVRFSHACLGSADLFRGGKCEGQGDDFLVRADRNPNNAGLNRAAGDRPVGTAEVLVEALEQGRYQALYFMGNDLPFAGDIQTERLHRCLSSLKLLVVQSLHTSELSRRAYIALPVASHAEQVGTYINCDGIAQVTEVAFPPRGSSLPDWDIYLRLSEALDGSPGFSGREDLSRELALEPVPPADPGFELENTRAPHGPQRPIPRRDATPVAGKRR